MALSRQVETVEFARRHLHIGEEQLDRLKSLLEDRPSLLHIRRLMHPEAGIGKDVCGIHPISASSSATKAYGVKSSDIAGSNSLVERLFRRLRSNPAAKNVCLAATAALAAGVLRPMLRFSGDGCRRIAKWEAATDYLKYLSTYSDSHGLGAVEYLSEGGRY